LQPLDADARIDAATLDFSGPFGQRLCDLYVDTLRGGETAAEVAENLGRTSPLVKSIFADANQVLAELSEDVDTVSAGQRYDLCVSEMVASFTGTAVWLGFRSALYERFAGKASTAELEECLRTAVKLW
jgi:hypothetical protein